MDFFQSQETLTTLEWILRAIVSYFFLLLIVKVMGQRSISQLSLLDFAIALIIGNIIAHPLSDEQLGLKGSMTTMSVLVLLYILSIFITLKSARLRRFVFPDAFPLIKNGQIISSNLGRARITVDYLLSAARREKIEDISKIALALWEPDGIISFFLIPVYQNVTRSDLNIAPEPFDFPITIVREGKVENEQLKLVDKDEEWLISTLRANHQVDVNEVLLATIDKNSKITLFLYNF